LTRHVSHLRRLPIDVLKIDRSFVTQVETDADDAALLGAIVSMAKVMRLRVVAEGVETEGQLSVLRELGCDEIQGNLLSKPVSADEIEALMQSSITIVLASGNVVQMPSKSKAN